MNKNRFDSFCEIVPTITAVITTVVVSRFFKMSFWETFLSGLLAGLVLLVITWIFKNISKKKLNIIIITRKLTVGKFKTTILLWNHSWIRDVYNNDYGEHGLGLIVDCGATIVKLSKPNGIRFAKNFKFCIIPDTVKNSLNLLMDTLTSKAFVEFNFEVHNSETTDSNSIIVLPSDIAIDKAFEKSPSISLHYDRANLNICELKYKKSLQLFHWVCRYLGVLIILGIIIFSVLYGYDTVYTFVGAILFTTFTSISVSIGGFVPAFVVRHMKNKGYINIKD